MDIKKIKELIKLVEETEISGLSVEEGSLKVEINKNAGAPQVFTAQAAAPAAPKATAATQETAASNIEAEGLVAIAAPMTGTFYEAASPETPPYVKIGDKVSVGQTVCIVEAMKTFNEIESEVAGTIEKIVVANQALIEEGMPLMYVRP